MLLAIADDDDELSIGIELLLEALLPILIILMLPDAAGVRALVVFPCANTGATIPAINDIAATIDTIAIKFTLGMYVFDNLDIYNIMDIGKYARKYMRYI